MRQRGAEPAAELGRRISSGEPCWFPGLANALLERFCQGAADLERYSTAAWLQLPAGTSVPVPDRPRIRIEPLPDIFLDRFSRSRVSDRVAAALASAAVARLDAGGAAAPVECLVRSIHPIAALGPGYDCSHSEPSIPFSVFGSVPAGENDAELRLAESLLHEAMHLQLTLVEREVPLVRATDTTGYSPWQRTERPIQGLVHGLYVFACIHQWLSALARRCDADPRAVAYSRRRRIEIAEEVTEVAALQDEPALTELGLLLVRRLLGVVRGDPGLAS